MHEGLSQQLKLVSLHKARIEKPKSTCARSVVFHVISVHAKSYPNSPIGHSLQQSSIQGITRSGELSLSWPPLLRRPASHWIAHSWTPCFDDDFSTPPRSRPTVVLPVSTTMARQAVHCKQTSLIHGENISSWRRTCWKLTAQC